MNLLLDLFSGNMQANAGSGLHAFIYYFSNSIGLLFFLVYLHQVVYLFLGTFTHTPIEHTPKRQAKIGIVVSARNESTVIENLIQSIRNSDYPQELYHIFVIADNCTDNTAQLCRDLGCFVFERNDTRLVGKGYALHYLFETLHTDPAWQAYVPDAYIVLDADNVIKPNYITEMNRVFDKGYEMVTSYRNSKNIGKNWISAGYGYWFMHEARHLNNSRMMLHTSCAISGTGFLISANLVKEFGNWNFYTLTEDIQCSTEYALSGRHVGYCASAELYDEQPETVAQSWRQRERWAKGFYQVFGKYGKSLFLGCFKCFACFDVLTTIFPALMITLSLFITLPVTAAVTAINGDYANCLFALQSLSGYIVMFYGLMAFIATLVVITEWDKIYCTNGKKILYIFTFPLFMFTYLPISVTALFKKVEWKPIYHSNSVNIEEIEKPQKVKVHL